MWLLLAHPPLGTWPVTQTCALTGNQTGNPLVRRPMLNALSYTSQGAFLLYSEHSGKICQLSVERTEVRGFLSWSHVLHFAFSCSSCIHMWYMCMRTSGGPLSQLCIQSAQSFCDPGLAKVTTSL